MTPPLDVDGDPLEGPRRWLAGLSSQPGGVNQLISEWVVASRLLAAGHTEVALRALLPAQVPLERRIPVMLTVGAVLTGTLIGAADAESPDGPLSARLGASAGQLDRAMVRDLIRAHRGEHVLLDALAELLVRYAAWEGS